MLRTVPNLIPSGIFYLPFALVDSLCPPPPCSSQVEVNSPSSSNTLKTLEEIEMELSNIEEEIRLLDEEEEKEKAKVSLGGDGEVYRFYEG